MMQTVVLGVAVAGSTATTAAVPSGIMLTLGPQALPPRV